MESGFHIGDLAPIRNTVVHQNYPAAAEHADFIQAYVAEQVALGRMSGPYSRADVERILGSPFISSPLSVVPKANGKLRLVQDCSKEDPDGLSVNGRIDADLFPTRWGSAAEVADLVSPSFFLHARPYGPRRLDPRESLAFARAGSAGSRARPGRQESCGGVAGAPAQRRRGVGGAELRSSAVWFPSSAMGAETRQPSQRPRTRLPPPAPSLTIALRSRAPPRVPRSLPWM